LFQESGLQHAISPEKIFDSNWKELFLFLNDRLSSVKQEYIISALGPNHLSILLTIANFYLLALIDSKCDYHKCYSEAFSTICCAVEVQRTGYKEICSIDSDLFVYYFFLNLDDSALISRLLKEGDINEYPLTLCLDVYRCYKSCNYHRFWRLWDSMDCLKQAALSRHAKSLGQHAEKAIFMAYKNKRFPYPESKFKRYTSLPATSKYHVDSKGVNFCVAQKAEFFNLDEMQTLRFNFADMPNLNCIKDSQSTYES
jgi:hypothetical protein